MNDEEEPTTSSEWMAYGFIAGVVFIIITVAYLLWEL